MENQKKTLDQTNISNPADTPDITAPDTTPPADNAKTLLSPSGLENSWADGLEGELKGNAYLKQFKNSDEALKSYVNLNKLVGKKGLIAPAQGASAEDVEAYLSTRRGGVPDADGYTTKWDDKVDAGMSKEDFGNFSQKLFEAGLSDAEHGKVMGAIRDYQQAQSALWLKQNNDAYEATMRDLKHEWGVDFEKKHAQVVQMMKQFPEAVNDLSELGAQNKLGVMKMLAAFAESLNEGIAPKGADSVDPGTIEKRIDALMKSKAYADVNSKGHKDAMEQFWALMQEAAMIKNNE